MMFSLRGNWIILFLILAMPIAAADLIWKNPVIGGICDPDRVRCRFYTAEYQAYAGWKASGTYHFVSTSTENVFVLEMVNGTLLRLIFYCKSGTLVTTRDNGNGTFGGYEFCETVPLKNGVRMLVDGTLVIPSTWSPDLSTPKLIFAGDLYVFEIRS